MSTDNRRLRLAREEWTWSNHLEKVFQRARARGMREGIRYLRSQICSTSRYHVIRHAMETIPEVAGPLDNLEVLEIARPDALLLQEMSRVWPHEFGPRDAQYVANVVGAHSANGALCLMLRCEGRFGGALWVSRPNPYYSHLSIPYLPGEHIAQNLFIVPQYRGMGASKFLLSRGLKIASQRGVSSVLGLVSVDNTPSLRASTSMHFRIVGSFVQKRRWFQSRDLFVSVEAGG